MINVSFLVSDDADSFYTQNPMSTSKKGKDILMFKNINQYDEGTRKHVAGNPQQIRQGILSVEFVLYVHCI